VTAAKCAGHVEGHLATRLRREESMTEDWEMEDEIRFAQSDVQDDAKEATEINKNDMVRQDFALISSSAQRLRTRSWI
jgi:hypothetical protein